MAHLEGEVVAVTGASGYIGGWVVSKLLDAGDSRNYTAFHVACAGGHVECVRLLCQAGCDTEVVNDVGLTGWELAAQLQRTKINALDKGELEVRARASPVSCCGFSL